MTANDVKVYLETEISNYPERADPEDFYRFILNRMNLLLPQKREQLVDTLRMWLNEATNTRTNLALEAAVEFKLIELKEDIRRLRDAVRAGQCFKPYYSEFIERHLKNLK